MITREEYLKLKKRYEDGYRWIARNENKWLYIYVIKPLRAERGWESSELNDYYTYEDDRLFQYIKWEDEKPTKINDLISDYEAHRVIVSESKNVNKTELVKEVEDILDDIGVSDFQLGECDEDTIWTISSITIRDILSAIEKHSPNDVKEKLYTVRLANGKCLYRFETVVIDWIKRYSNYKNDSDFQLTKAEIESVDPRLMQFAVEVE